MRETERTSRLLVKQMRLSSPGKTDLHAPFDSKKHTGSGVTIYTYIYVYIYIYIHQKYNHSI